MPYKPAHPCKHPGCPGLTHGDYCEKHAAIYAGLPRARKPKRAKDPRPGIYQREGYGPAWRKIRSRYLKEHPICEYCGSRPATQVDHRIPLEEGGGHDDWNLAAACQACHNRKTGREKGLKTAKKG